MTPIEKNADGKYLSRRGILTRVPTGYRAPCPFCRNGFLPSQQAYKFCNVDPKEVKIYSLYTHLSCADNRSKNRAGCEEDAARISDAQVVKFWESMETLMAKHVENSGREALICRQNTKKS